MRVVVLTAFVIGVFFVLHVLRHLLVPLILAIIIGLLIDSETSLLSKRLAHWPRWIRMTIGPVFTVALFGGVVLLTINQSGPFLSELKGLEPRINADLATISTRLGVKPLTLSNLAGNHDPSRETGKILNFTQNIAGDTTLVLLYVAFLLASRASISRKIDLLSDTAGRGRASFERVVGRIGRSVGTFVGLQAFKGAVIGGSAAIVGTVFGVPNSLFAALVGFLLSFIPAIGTYLGAALPALVAFGLDPAPTRAVEMALILIPLVFVFDNVVLPRFQSRSLNLDLTLSIFGIGVWGMVFGLPGILLSTPLTASCLALASEFKSTRWVAIMLSQEGDIN